MKKILLIFSLCLIFINFASAFTWNPTAYYDFEAGTGTRVPDIQFYTSNGTLYNALWKSPKLGQYGLSFDGTSLVTVANTPNVSMSVGSISVWVNRTGASDDMFIFTKGDGDSTQQNYALRYDTTASAGFRFDVGDGVGTSTTTTGQLVESGIYNHVVVTWNATTINIWVNGTHKSMAATGYTVGTNSANFTIGRSRFDGFGASWVGTLDEIGLFNRVLSSADIAELYNSGMGLANPRSTLPASVSVTLNSPANNSVSSTGYVTFNVSMTSTLNLTNNSIYIWFINGTQSINPQLQIVTGLSNTTDLEIGTFDIGSYKWNSLACIANSTFSLCSFAPSNYTFSIGVTNSSAYVFNTTTTETALEGFSVNVTVPGSDTLLTSNFYYNGQRYSSTITSLGGSAYRLSSSISIPIGIGNKNFFFETGLSSGLKQNITSASQTVNTLILGYCNSTVNVPSLNFTLWDEQNLTRIVPMRFDGTLNYWAGDGSVRKNLSISNQSTTEVVVCFASSGQTYGLDAQIEYNTGNISGYTSRSYYFQDHIINSTLQNIQLFLLRSASATSFIVKVQDFTLQPIAGALVKIQRYYPGTNTFETVQVVETDDNGKSVAFYETETVDYRHIISKNGAILLATSQQKIFAEETPYTLTFTIGDSLDIPWLDFISNPNITATVSYNDSTKIVSYVYADSNSQATSGRLKVSFLNASGNDFDVCDSSFSGSSGTITCNVGAYNGTFVARGYITFPSGERLVAITYNIVFNSIINIINKQGLFLAWFIILTMAMVGIWNPTVGIILVNASVIFLTFIQLASFSPIFIFGMIAISITLIILLET